MHSVPYFYKDHGFDTELMGFVVLQDTEKPFSCKRDSKYEVYLYKSNDATNERITTYAY